MKEITLEKVTRFSILMLLLRVQTKPSLLVGLFLWRYFRSISKPEERFFLPGIIYRLNNYNTSHSCMLLFGHEINLMYSYIA